MWKSPLLAAACLLAVAALSTHVSANGLVNEEVKRTVDLSTHLAKITAEIVLSNQGPSAAQSFILAVEADLVPHLAYIGASVRPALIDKTTFMRTLGFNQSVSISILATAL